MTSQTDTIHLDLGTALRLIFDLFAERGRLIRTQQPLAAEAPISPDASTDRVDSESLGD